MPRSIRLLSLAAFVALPVTAVVLLGSGDRRETVPLPEERQMAFRQEMKGHMVDLRDLTRAMATGEYGKAAKLAEDRMDFGAFLGDGTGSDGETRAARWSDAIPEDFKAKGLDLQDAADRFIRVARRRERSGDMGGERAMNQAYQDLVDACRTCHAHYRVHREPR